MSNSLKILLVEDNILNQKITSFGLKKFCHQVEIANNGLEAIDMFKDSDYDVVLMDIMMPVMDGYEATSKIRDYEKQRGLIKSTPIIAITANTLDNDRDKCLSIGMDEFMPKPFDINRLNEIFKELSIIA